MSLKHNCAECGSDLEFPEEAERICCPRCSQHFLVKIYENVVTLKRYIPSAAEREPAEKSYQPAPLPISYTPQEALALLEREIASADRILRQRRSSALSSLSVAFLFFFFALSGFLLDRQLMAVCCGTITAAMLAVTGSALLESARSRDSLTILITRREQLRREIGPNIPRIF